MTITPRLLMVTSAVALAISIFSEREVKAQKFELIPDGGVRAECRVTSSDDDGISICCDTYMSVPIRFHKDDLGQVETAGFVSIWIEDITDDTGGAPKRCFAVDGKDNQSCIPRSIIAYMYAQMSGTCVMSAE